MTPVPRLRRCGAKAVKKSDRAGARKLRIELARKDRKKKWWRR